MRLSRKDAATIRTAICIAIESERDLIDVYSKCTTDSDKETVAKSRKLIAELLELRKRLPNRQ